MINPICSESDDMAVDVASAFAWLITITTTCIAYINPYLIANRRDLDQNALKGQ
jgi:hypothetical protein